MTFDPKSASAEEKAAYAAGLAAKIEGETPPLTLADIRGMSAREIMARKREVDAVLREPIKPTDDE